MQILRVRHRESTFYAALHDADHVRCLNKDLNRPDPIALAEVQVLPCVLPTKIVCVGLNYKGHAEEMGKPLPAEPLIFLKPPSAVVGTGEAIILPPSAGRVDHEAELALVIGQPCRNVSPGESLNRIFGYTCANDVTARDLQARDGLYARAKGFDTFCPVGPWIETQAPDTAGVAIRALVNGQVRQNGHTSDMIFSPAQIVSFISRVMTLFPGDMVLTGTPAGIGPIAAGDVVQVEIEGLGLLMNPVLAESQAEPAVQ